jgi:hypothetical protein
MYRLDEREAFRAMYLTLSADYREFSLRDERAAAVDARELGIPRDLIVDLREWNGAYQRVIPAGSSERGGEPMASQISELDRTGLALAERVAAVLDGDVKVKYYSEGLLRLLA